MEENGVPHEVCNTDPIADTAEDSFYEWVNSLQPPRMRSRIPVWPDFSNIMYGVYNNSRSTENDRAGSAFEEELDDQFLYMHMMAS